MINGHLRSVQCPRSLNTYAVLIKKLFFFFNLLSAFYYQGDVSNKNFLICLWFIGLNTEWKGYELVPRLQEMNARCARVVLFDAIVETIIYYTNERMLLNFLFTYPFNG